MRIHNKFIKFVPEGFRCYFPNITISLVRSGIQRKANEFCFRVPRILNKYDIAQYLEGLYGLNIQSIKTVNFVAKYSKMRGIKHPAKKTAIVTVKEELDSETGKALPIWKWPDDVVNAGPGAPPYYQPVKFPSATKR